ncbi:hypothetical protein DPMN_073378 [Dreissena polymorpha]|uniref:Uncharacterized protein n=1 Tax=Dreissena polymorpha TaxID=45954 RepID=A0A9D4BYX5_DREPO|nr:hypothetical protein DPMN_073378 [Dreissena polymorpha]
MLESRLWISVGTTYAYRVPSACALHYGLTRPSKTSTFPGTVSARKDARHWARRFR